MSILHPPDCWTTFLSRNHCRASINRAMSIRRTPPKPPPSGVIGLPRINLDSTLTDILKRASPQDAHKRLAYIHSLGHCGIGLSPHVPRNQIFLYQDGCFVKTPRTDLSEANTDLRRSLAAKYLNVVPQRDTFITGGSVVVLFDSGTSDAETLHSRRQAEATLSVLDDTQRPELVHCPGPFSMTTKAGIDMIAGYKIALDGFTRGEIPLTVDLEKHWYLNSKGALATSGLPTPQTEVVEVSGYPVPAQECCDICTREFASRDHDMIPTIPASCTGQRGTWLRKHELRIVSAVERRPVPFAFKTQQTFGGGGTWIVDSSREKRQLLNHLVEEDGIIRKLLPLLNRGNHHLHPGSMLLSDLIQDPVENYGATFYVTDTGGVIFMGISEQLLASDGKAWVGSIISYKSQMRLHRRLQPLMEQTAQWLSREHDYCGPVGMDVLEAKTTGTTDTGKDGTGLYIVDLNVRTSGSMSLPLLKGHFTSRGLFCAGISMVTTSKGRHEFIDQWRSDFLSGSMIILSWHEDSQSSASVGSVIMGAEDKKTLEDKTQRLKSSTEDVTF